MSQMQDFTYVRRLLGQRIRLLTLHPGTESVVEASIQEHGLRACPPYAALSYTWGEPAPLLPIALNGGLFYVRENLWLFLQHYRNGTEDSILWIDAICINQNDVKERNQQVQLMGQIYKQADEVAVWLGVHQDESEVAMSYLEKCEGLLSLQNQPAMGNRGRGPENELFDMTTKLVDDNARYLEQLQALQKANPNPPRTESGYADENYHQAVEEILRATETKNEAGVFPHWDYQLENAVANLLHRDYWKRLWVVQEFGLAKRIRIYCGTQFASFETLEAATWKNHAELFRFENFMRQRPERDITGSPAEELTLVRESVVPYRTLESLLRTTTTQGLLCSLTHDRIYGLLGIVTYTNGNAPLAVNYNASLRDLTFDVLEHEQPGDELHTMQNLKMPKIAQCYGEICSHLRIPKLMQVNELHALSPRGRRIDCTLRFHGQTQAVLPITIHPRANQEAGLKDLHESALNSLHRMTDQDYLRQEYHMQAGFQVPAFSSGAGPSHISPAELIWDPPTPGTRPPSESYAIIRSKEANQEVLQVDDTQYRVQYLAFFSTTRDSLPSEPGDLLYATTMKYWGYDEKTNEHATCFFAFRKLPDRQGEAVYRLVHLARAWRLPIPPANEPLPPTGPSSSSTVVSCLEPLSSSLKELDVTAQPEFPAVLELKLDFIALLALILPFEKGLESVVHAEITAKGKTAWSSDPRRALWSIYE